MSEILSFLWGHPSLTAILAYVLLCIVLYMRGDNRTIDQQKDNMYGSAKGWRGRMLDREKMARNDAILYTVARWAVMLFLLYRFCKFAKWI